MRELFRIALLKSILLGCKAAKARAEIDRAEVSE